MNKVIAVVGPTASGKTALAVELALHCCGEVISADSMQIYRGMPIATAAVTADEARGVPHHLVGCIDPGEEFSVARFTETAKPIIDDICSRGKLPVIAGGTGLFVDSLLRNIQFLEQNNAAEIRQKLVSRLQGEGIEPLYAELAQLDPDAAQKIHINNTKRVLRALEVYYSTGMTITRQEELSRQNPPLFDPLYIGINYDDREILYDRINRRVDAMVQNGLLDEARAALSLGGATASQAIGHKELKPYFDGEITLDEAVENLKRQTRRYAKRQLTWFRRGKNINWLYPDRYQHIQQLYDEAFNLADNFLNGR